MKSISIIIALLVSSISTANADQNTYEKNGMPCMDEVCLGDSLEELSKVNFDTATMMGKGTPPVSSYKPRQNEIDMLSSKYKGNIKPISTYLSRSQFDNKTIQGLAEITATCTLGANLDGTFTSKGGNPTQVKISLLPTSDTSKQAWIVTGIYRSYLSAKSEEQRKEVHTEMDARYNKYTKGMTKSGKPVYLYNTGYTSNPERVTLLLPSGLDIQNQLVLHPLCGGKNAVHLD